MIRTRPVPELAPRELARFESRIDRSGDHHLWTSTKLPTGYGVIRIRGRRYLAHRVAYRQTFGPIPPGLVIDHLCNTPSCVRIDHLRACTQRENVRAGRAYLGDGLCRAGLHPMATDAYVRPDGTRQCQPCRVAYDAQRYALSRQQATT